jgi:putative membrane protein
MTAMMFWYGGHWAFWQIGLGWAGMVAFWGLLIWGGYALIASVTRKPADKEHGGDPRRILDQRLARGEIDAEQYQRLRDLLTSDSRHAPSGADRST